MENNQMMLGKSVQGWSGNRGTNEVKTITMCVTEDCNLACKYCYMSGKNHIRKMNYETAKKAIDYIFSNPDEFTEGSVIWDFIGGEPFLEIDLIDKISDYIKFKMFSLNHPWFDSYRFSFATNGLLYGTEKVQKYIKKNRDHLSIGISVDGNKTKHDLQRVYKDGSGSYDNVMKNVKLWQSQFGNAQTKATFAHDDLIHLKDSIISLWNNGIKDVSANVVFEDVWKDGDDEILERQLDELGDYILENQLWNDYNVRFFDCGIGHPLKSDAQNHNFCGSGKMLAIDCDGNFYPCIRFLDFSLNKRKGRSIGNVDSKINNDKLRAFKTLTLKSQSKQECLECEVASGCALCTGYNYDEAGSIYERATNICKLHKATVRANKRFWNKYERLTGNVSPRREYEDSNNKKYMLVMVSDDITPHCSYRNFNNTKNVISKDTIEKAIEFAIDNDLEVVFLGDESKVLGNPDDKHMTILDARSIKKNNNSIIIFDNEVKTLESKIETCIILINKNNIEKIAEFVNKAAEFSSRINIIHEDLEQWNENSLEEYNAQLSTLVDFLEKSYQAGKEIELNILTDRIYLEKHIDCKAGVTSFTLAPNGKFYSCPAFYFNNIDDSIGSLEEGIINKNDKLMNIKNAPICHECDAYQCNACKYLNKKITEEYNTPSKMQCLISHYERNKSRELQQRLLDKGIRLNGANIIDEIYYLDPIEKIKVN